MTVELPPPLPPQPGHSYAPKALLASWQNKQPIDGGFPDSVFVSFIDGGSP